MTSVLPPGAKGTTIRSGRSGDQPSDRAAPAARRGSARVARLVNRITTN